MNKKVLTYILILLCVATLVWAADVTYGPKVYKDSGGDREVVADGGTIKAESGGSVDMEAGSTFYASGFAVSSKVYSAAEAWTLSTTEAKSTLLIVSSGSGSPTIIAPAISGKIFILRNAANANVDVTLKVSGLTGITVACGKTAVLINNGTDYIRVTGDATH